MATSDNKLATFSRGSEEEYSLVCLPCHRDENHPTRPAHGYCIDCNEHLCYTCYIHHTKPTPCRHHKLQDKDTMPSTQQLVDAPTYDVHTGNTDNLLTPCPQHKTEMIKLFCHDHDLLLCSICVALEHAKPCHVDFIPNISDKMINSQDYKQTIGRIDELVEKCTTIISERSKVANISNDSLTEVLRDTKKYRTEINKRIDQLEKDIEAKIKALQHQNDENEKTVETICKDIKNTVKTAYDSMKSLNTSKQSNQLFIEVKKAQQHLHDFEQSIRSLSADTSINEYKFSPNQKIKDALMKEKMIGDISKNPQPEACSSSQANNLAASAEVTITPTSPCEICVKTSSDKQRCMIMGGMTVLPSERLVLADWDNKSIKLLDTNSKSIISYLTLGTEDADRPWGITTITNTEVAVAVPGRKHIQFISVRKTFMSFSDKLSKSHTIRTDGECCGICCHQDKLIVTYLKPAKLEIMDMRGIVITRMTTDSTGTDIFTRPGYVQVNIGSIYVSELGSNMVIRLNWNGEITGRITGIEKTAGIASLHDGSILVCDWKNARVCHVDGDGTNNRIAIKDVMRPRAICVDETGHKLYISRLAMKDNLDNNILMYNI